MNRSLILFLAMLALIGCNTPTSKEPDTPQTEKPDSASDPTSSESPVSGSKGGATKPLNSFVGDIEGYHQAILDSGRLVPAYDTIMTSVCDSLLSRNPERLSHHFKVFTTALNGSDGFYAELAGSVALTYVMEQPDRYSHFMITEGYSPEDRQNWSMALMGEIMINAEEGKEWQTFYQLKALVDDQLATGRKDYRSEMDQLMNLVRGRLAKTNLNLKAFWDQSVVPFIEGGPKDVEALIIFPLKGEWGFLMGLEKPEEEWVPEDFFAHYDRLFTDRIRQLIREKGWKGSELMVHDDGMIELITSVGWNNEDGTESAILFRFKEVQGQFKLHVVQAAG